jgi:glycerol-3-phosphate dehydrogenase (NAD(P)+)
MAASEPVAVLGAGSWGTALAILLARNGFAVRLWGHDAAHMAELARARRNPLHLPDIEFPSTVEPSADLPALCASSRDFLLAVPSQFFRATLEALRSAGLREGATLAWGTKGLDAESGVVLGETMLSVFADSVHRAVISGPSFAGEVARGLPTALTVAADETAVAERVAGWLRNSRVRVYTNDDMTGVQLGGAIKNVIALAAGISNGLGFGANARAALITRGLAEMARLGVALGGKAETFMGLTGLGDLVLTCTDTQSRNLRAGMALGQGHPLAEVLREIGQEVEGVHTARTLYALAERRGLDAPIIEQVYRILYEGVAPQQAVEELFRREPKSEQLAGR